MTDRITPADIVDAALKLLSGGGLHALPMRGIASALGVQQSALYWHFESKQRLLAAIADRIVAPVDVPTGTEPSLRIQALALRMRTELLRYPDGAELVATAFAFRLGAQRPFQQFTTELTNGGLTLDHAEIAALVLVHFIHGYVTDEQQHHQAAELGAIEHAFDGYALASADDRFVRGVHLIITGVRRP